MNNKTQAMKPGYEIQYCTDTKKFQKSRCDNKKII